MFNGSEVWFHYHGESDPCVSQCYQVPKEGRGSRTMRMEHNHIFQKDNGVADCSACESIELYHMSEIYFAKANAARISAAWV